MLSFHKCPVADTVFSLIAIMLGRLRMSTEDALKYYNEISSHVFSRGNRKWRMQDGAFKATTLKEKMVEVVAGCGIAGYTGKERMLDSGVEREMGKA